MTRKELLMFAFHLLGISCLCGAVALESLVFFDIVWQGYFVAVEENKFVLGGEVLLVGFTVLYCVFLWKRFIAHGELKA